MSSHFDDSDEDEYAAPPRAMHPPANPARRPTHAREQSFSDMSDSSRAESSRQPADHARSLASRFESTVSPRSDRVSNSVPFDFDDDMSSLYGGAGGGRDATDFDFGDGPEGEVDEPLEADMDDVRRLGLVWVRERGTGQIMKWENELIDSVFDKLEQQQKLVDTLRSDPETSEEEHFKLVLVMTEMERVKYLVRSYVRTRLWKIEKYSQHIVRSPELHDLLSGAEMSHARRYTELLHGHFKHSVLDSLPEWLQKMDDTYGDGLSMIPKPNKNAPVLIYCRRNCGMVNLADGYSSALDKGTTHLVKYSMVEQWIKLGWAEVL